MLDQGFGNDPAAVVAALGTLGGEIFGIVNVDLDVFAVALGEVQQERRKQGTGRTSAYDGNPGTIFKGQPTFMRFFCQIVESDKSFPPEMLTNRSKLYQNSLYM